jgi:hypothetical protein
MTSFKPWPTASVHPAATSSAIPATTNRARYGARNFASRLSVRTTGTRRAESVEAAMLEAL